MSNTDSGVDAGSDSNESGTMSFGSSAEEDTGDNGTSADDNSHSSLNEDGASGEKNWTFFPQSLAVTSYLSVRLNDGDEFSYARNHQHDYLPKLKSKYINKRLNRRGGWFFNSQIAERKLRHAANLNQVEYMRTLLEQGVNPRAFDNRKRTALHFAACKGHLEIAKMLLQRGADPNQKDIVGNTPLHLAVCANRVDVITLLLKAGTDLSAIDNNGRTALNIARSKMRLLQNSASYSSCQLKDEVLQIIRMIQIYLQKSGQFAKVDALSFFTSQLHLHHTKEEVDQDVQELLMSLEHLKIKF